MKKSHRLGAVCAVTMFAIISSVNAELIAGDDTSITSTDQSYDLTLAVSPSLSSDVVLATDMFGAFDQTQADRDFNYIKDDILSTSPQTNAHNNPHTSSHKDLWLLLIVAAVVSILSEISHQRYFHR
jgi:hypothetical protein